MVDFVLLEDNHNHMDKTEDIVVTYMMKNNYEFTIQKFYEASKDFYKLVEETDKNHIYILDFEVGNTTAIEVARKIRLRDWISPIIIFTVNGGMALETFKQRLQILDFVSKQFEAEKNLNELFDICFDQLNLRKSFKYKIGRNDYSIDFDKILYVYKDTYERKSVIVTEKSEYKVPLSLVKIKEMLPNYFVFTHKACIVNSKRVDAYVWNEGKVIFDDGKEALFLSKTHRKELENR